MAPNKTMPNILNPMGKVQSTIASHRMAIGKSAYMERSGGNKFLDTGIFSDTSKKQFSEWLDTQTNNTAISQDPEMKRLESYRRYTTLDHALTWANANQLAPRDMSQLKRSFAPAGQSTQMIIGATPETDRHIMDLTEGLYKKYALKRVFYSAYLPVVGIAGGLAFCRGRRSHPFTYILKVCVVCAFVPILNSLFYALNSSYYARWYYMPVLVLCGATAPAIRQAVESAPEFAGSGLEILETHDLAAAVAAAQGAAVAGDVVVLSPACAAFDQFKNFMVRGAFFKKLVKEL